MVITNEGPLDCAGHGDNTSVAGFDVRPNCSSSLHANGVVFLALAILLAGISAFFAWWGAWLVLPFAGLELLILGAGLVFCRRSQEHVEHIRIGKQEVTVKNKSGTYVFQRAWLQVELRPPALRNHPSRLLLGSHGRRIEVGDFLCENEKREFADRLRAELLQGIKNSAAWCSPKGVYV